MCFKIDLDDVSSLNPHEAVEEERVKTLLDNLIRSKVLRRPLLIDHNTMTILDGHHRYEALLRLKARKVPVIKIDYINDRDVVVDKWVRTYLIRKELDLRILKDLIEGIFKIDTTSINYVRGRIIRVVDSKTSDPLNFYKLIYDLERKLRAYVIESRVREPGQRIKYSKSSGHLMLIIDPPKLNKTHVINAATNGERLPPRSTRHITPLKKLILPVPLSKLL